MCGTNWLMLVTIGVSDSRPLIFAVSDGPTADHDGLSFETLQRGKFLVNETFLAIVAARFHIARFPAQGNVRAFAAEQRFPDPLGRDLAGHSIPPAITRSSLPLRFHRAMT